METFIEEKIRERIPPEDVKKCVDIAVSVHTYDMCISLLTEHCLQVVEVKFGSEEKSPLENLWCYSSTQIFPMEEDLSDQVKFAPNT